MTFTDEDLKKLKELDSAGSVHDKYVNESIRMAIPGLLARMEMAEDAYLVAWRMINSEATWNELVKAGNAWRKAAGK